METFLHDGKNLIGHWRRAAPYTYHGAKTPANGNRLMNAEALRDTQDAMTCATFPPEDVWWSWSKSKRKRFRRKMRELNAR